jgi:hypothetical protein
MPSAARRPLRLDRLEDRATPALAVGLLAGTPADQLVLFDPDHPGTIQRTETLVGLQPGESLLGLDVRPAINQLYGLGSTGRLYTIDLSAGVATLVNPTPAFTPSGTEFDIDFDPVADRLRVVGDADQNLRLNPSNGTLAGTDPTLAYAAGDPHAGADPNIVGAAYTGNVAGANATTLYGIDSNLNVLVTIDPATGRLSTVGPLGVDTSALVGFDIMTVDVNDTAYAALQVGGTSRLYTIDLSTGAATEVGAIGTGAAVRDVAVIKDPATTGGTALMAVGSGPGGPPTVKVYRADGTLAISFNAYDPSCTGGVRVAVAEVTGDTVPDVITAAGPGGGPHVKVFDGSALLVGAVVEARSFFAYDAHFTGGVYVAARNGPSGPADIITGAGPGGGPHVKVFDPVTLAEKRSFYAYDAAFRGGVTVAAGDVTGDGVPDIVTGAGPGGGPHVKVFDGVTGMEVRSFFAFDASFHGGVYVAAGRVADLATTGDPAGDANADIMVGAGPGGGPHVKIFSGADGSVLRSFYAYDGSFRGGVRVAAADLTGDGLDELITGAGPGGGPHVQVFREGTGPELMSFFAFDPTFLGGVYVGGEWVPPPGPPV